MHIDIVARLYGPRRKPAAGFFIAQCKACERGFGLPKPVRRIFIKFDTSGNSLA
jgi:hypothetical protein